MYPIAEQTGHKFFQEASKLPAVRNLPPPREVPAKVGIGLRNAMLNTTVGPFLLIFTVASWILFKLVSVVNHPKDFKDKAIAVCRNPKTSTQAAVQKLASTALYMSTNILKKIDQEPIETFVEFSTGALLAKFLSPLGATLYKKNQELLNHQLAKYEITKQFLSFIDNLAGFSYTTPFSTIRDKCKNFQKWFANNEGAIKRYLPYEYANLPSFLNELQKDGLYYKTLKQIQWKSWSVHRELSRNFESILIRRICSIFTRAMRDFPLFFPYIIALKGLAKIQDAPVPINNQALIGPCPYQQQPALDIDKRIKHLEKLSQAAANNQGGKKKRKKAQEAQLQLNIHLEVLKSKLSNMKPK